MDTADANGDREPFKNIDESTILNNQESIAKDSSISLPIKSNPTVSQASERLRNATDAALRFFANASNETLGACAVGLCASTYLVLGRVGLVLIGAVGGIVLHATWESQLNAGRGGHSGLVESNRRRRELGAEVVKRVLDWRESSRASGEDGVNGSEKVEASLATQTLDYADFKPATGAALTAFTDAVIRDYVKWWYGPILPTDASFPAACRQTLTSFIISISNHLSRKRPADPFLDFLANSTSIVIVFLNELSAALKASQRQDPEDAIRTYLQYQPESNLAQVLSTAQQERKLNLVADDILQTFLDSKAYNFPPAKIFLREVLATLILGSTITTCSKPEWINGWIVYLLEDGEPELLNAIDAGVEDMGNVVANARARALSSPAQDKGHQRRVSRAEEAMQEAMAEVKRMNDMIAEEETRKRKEISIAEGEDTVSTATTEAGIATPTSSDSERKRSGEYSMESSMVFDSDGNVIPKISPSKQRAPPTTFDQMGALPGVPTALQTQSTSSPILDTASPVQTLTLQNAIITIFDDSDPSDKSLLRQKPSGDYLLQIEPASSRFPGWMIPRKYTEFEALHESIRRIAVISGVQEFAQKYVALPAWKGQSRAVLSSNLEAYLKEALRFERIAESEAMKKFLEKETGLAKAPAQPKNVLVQGSAALENVGKGFINVLGQGGKGIAGGGKAVFGGVQGVFGAVAKEVGGAGQKRQSATVQRPTAQRSESYADRLSQDLRRSSTSLSDVSKTPPLPSRPVRMSTDLETATRTASRSSSQSRDAQQMSDRMVMNLPPPPSEVMDDYVPLRQSFDSIGAAGTGTSTPHTPSLAGSSRPATPTRPPTSDSKAEPVVVAPIEAKTEDEAAPAKPVPMMNIPSKPTTTAMPITEEETRVSIELLFAIITELYSLSSAWTIRLSLLSAAKTFLLRPANPQLESIRALLQDSVLDSNFSDAGLSAHVLKLRENTLPTEEELKLWPGEMSGAEKEELRVKARKLLVERGMPQALTGVMGMAASGEALGRVFDCLQVGEVSRGLVFALVLQGLRAATQ